jgi:hypothetical protein
MKQLENLAKRITKLSTDLKAEVVLTDLIEGGFNADDVIVYPVGLGKRRYSRDIDSVQVIEGNMRNHQLHVQVNREGLYDIVPQNLFHQPLKRNPQRNTDQVLEEIRRNRKLEKETRRFFLPLEQEFYRHRLLVEVEERRLLLDDKADAQSELFTRFWNFPRFLDAQQCFNLVFLLPLVHKIVGDLETAAICYSYLLNQPVRIENVPPPRRPLPEAPEMFLGGPTLGVDFVVGEEYADLIPGLRVTIGPIDKESVPEFLPTGRMTKVADYLAGFLLPFEAEVETVLEIEESGRTFALGADEFSGRLGVTTGI